MIPENYIKIHDKGYVGLVDYMGDDSKVVNSARISFNKKIDGDLAEKDEKLLKYLWTNGHKSVFRHCSLTFEVYAPLMVARQWLKYSVASAHLEDQNGWNESSRRYVTEEPEFYIPNANQWRSTPANKKQGSGKNLNNGIGYAYTLLLEEYISQGEKLYKQALDENICAEQARLFLPSYGMYLRWYWTCSLASLMHFLTERLDSHAQFEMQVYASAVRALAMEKFPLSIGLLDD